MTTILGLDLGKFNEDLGCMVVPTDADPFQTTEQRGKSARWKGTILGTSGSLHSDFLAHNQSRSISAAVSSRLLRIPGLDSRNPVLESCDGNNG
jgi:hypothetical protein